MRFFSGDEDGGRTCGQSCPVDFKGDVAFCCPREENSGRRGRMYEFGATWPGWAAAGEEEVNEEVN